MRRSRSRSPVRDSRGRDRDRDRDRDRGDYGGGSGSGYGYSRGGGGGGGGYENNDRRGGRDDGGSYYRNRRQRSRSRSRERDRGGYYGGSSRRDDEPGSGYYARDSSRGGGGGALPPPPPMPSSAPTTTATTTATTAAPRPPPLSLEELVRKRQEEAAAASKPVFMTKAQREAAALERRRAEVAAGGGGGRSTGGGGGDLDLDVLLDRRRNSNDHHHHSRHHHSPPPRDREREAQLAAIKKHYLGDPRPEKKKAYKASERTKFVFDWDAKAEDTAAGADPLLLPTGGAARAGGGGGGNRSSSALPSASSSGRDGGAGAVASQALLFGRGRLAGVDDGMMERRRGGGGGGGGGSRGGGSRGGDGGANGAKGGGERDENSASHWFRKPREEMTERDWRIFREDFSIAYKGAGWMGGSGGGGSAAAAASASAAPASAAAASAAANANAVAAALAPSLLPIRNWAEASLPDPLLRAVQAAGYEKPSPIQMAAIPLGLAQRDVIGVAETGSGKTAAFALPMLSYCLKQPPMAGDERVASDGPYALVMAPTRELAQQIEEETRKLARFTPFRVVAVVGGQPIEEQGVKLRRGAEVVVATPGRLADCLERAYAVLNQCHYVVLDEADRMIDMGFEPQVVKVLEAMPAAALKPADVDIDEIVASSPNSNDGVKKSIYRTTYMFSATMPPAVERLARTYLRRPVVVTIGRAGRATDNVTQRVVMVKENEKPAALLAAIRGSGSGGSSSSSSSRDPAASRTIVFVNTRNASDAVARALEGAGKRVVVLHGGKSQDAREAGLAAFRAGTTDFLVATDVAGRGIDVAGVGLVVNYDMPGTIDAYTHRIGRTGRAGKKGEAVTFLTSGDADVYYDLKKLLEESRAVVPSALASHEASRQPGGGRRGGGGPESKGNAAILY